MNWSQVLLTEIYYLGTVWTDFFLPVIWTRHKTGCQECYLGTTSTERNVTIPVIWTRQKTACQQCYLGTTSTERNVTIPVIWNRHKTGWQESHLGTVSTGRIVTCNLNWQQDWLTGMFVANWWGTPSGNCHISKRKESCDFIYDILFYYILWYTMGINHKITG